MVRGRVHRAPRAAIVSERRDDERVVPAARETPQTESPRRAAAAADADAAVADAVQRDRGIVHRPRVPSIPRQRPRRSGRAPRVEQSDRVSASRAEPDGPVVDAAHRLADFKPVDADGVRPRVAVVPEVPVPAHRDRDVPRRRRRARVVHARAVRGRDDDDVAARARRRRHSQRDVRIVVRHVDHLGHRPRLDVDREEVRMRAHPQRRRARAGVVPAAVRGAPEIVPVRARDALDGHRLRGPRQRGLRAELVVREVDENVRLVGVFIIRGPHAHEPHDVVVPRPDRDDGGAHERERVDVDDVVAFVQLDDVRVQKRHPRVPDVERVRVPHGDSAVPIARDEDAVRGRERAVVRAGGRRPRRVRERRDAFPRLRRAVAAVEPELDLFGVAADGGGAVREELRVRVDLDASRTTKSPSPSSNPRSPSPSSPSSSSSPSPSSSSPSPSSPSSSSSSTDASFSGIHRSAFSADAHAAAHARFPPSSSIASFDVSTGGAPGRCVGGGGGGATLPNIAACAACLTCGDRATSRSARDAAASREMLRGSMNDATISQHVVGMRFSGSRGGSSTRIARIPRVVAATSSSSSPPPPPPPPPRAASGHKSSSSSSSLRASRRATTLRTRWYGGSRSRSPPPPPPPTTTGDLGEKAAFDDVGSHDPPTPPPGETGIASSKPKLPPLCAFILKNTASGVSFSPRLFTRALHAVSPLFLSFATAWSTVTTTTSSIPSAAPVDGETPPP
eukprot:11773-Pelagococcus_subviridis.AAC.1